MALFDNYNNLGNAIPNNLYARYPVKEPSRMPYEQYNAQGKLVGYYWNYGDTVNLEFNLTGEISVEGDALIFNQKGQIPTSTTEGYLGQKAYNIVDMLSWTLVSIQEGLYGWTLDSEFTYPTEGAKNLYVDIAEYVKGKKVVVSLYNFRMERIDVKSFEGSTKIVYTIDRDMSRKLAKGIYYCSVEVVDVAACTFITVVDHNSFLLEVK